MQVTSLTLCAVLCCLASVVSRANADEEWPTYMCDNARSGVIDAVVEFPLQRVWRYRPPFAPRPAWRAEALMDGYNKVFGLVDRQTFDKAFHVVGDSDRIYYGCSVTDQVYCLNAHDGSREWTFFAEGPIRFAPTIAGDSALFGSDDGYVYCIDRITGDLKWRSLGGERNIRIPGNGRLISKWPIRTGLVVRDKKVYGSAGMFPSDGVYLFALDLSTGANLWRRLNRDLPAQGYMLCSDDRLYVPSGRNNPVVYARSSGERVTVIEGQGGAFCLLTEDELISGPGKLGQLGLSDSSAGERVATLEGLRACVKDEKMVVLRSEEVEAINYLKRRQLVDERKTLLDLRAAVMKSLRDAPEDRDRDTSDSAMDGELSKLSSRLSGVDQLIEQCSLWTTSINEPRSLIVTATSVIIGCSSSVVAVNLDTGRIEWSHQVEGEALGLAWIAGQLIVSLESGEILSFAHPGR